MLALSVTLVNNVTQKLRKLAIATDDYSQVWPLVDVYLRKRISEQFRSEGRACGTPWPPLSEVTIARRVKRYNIKKEGKHRILVDTGALKASLTSYTGDSIRKEYKTKFVFGTRLRYARLHQYGSPRDNIPARPMIVVKAEEIAAFVRRYIHDVIRRP